MGCLDEIIAMGCDRVWALIVGKEENDIRSICSEGDRTQ
jgi:hypothetical protein